MQASAIPPVRRELRDILDIGEKLLQCMLDYTCVGGRDMYEGYFETHYDTWYNTAHKLVSITCPHRLKEFERLYYADDARIAIDKDNYTIHDWLQERDVEWEHTPEDICLTRLHHQLEIVKAIEGILDSSIYWLESLVRSDILNTELEQAEELAKKGYLRAAASVAGVVFETTVSYMVDRLPDAKERMSLKEKIDALGRAGVLDPGESYRFKRMNYLRNRAAHKGPEPSSEEAAEMIQAGRAIAEKFA